MALTIANRKRHFLSNRRLHTGQITFDSSYVQGGEALSARDLALLRVDVVEFETAQGYTFLYDYTNAKVKVYYGASLGLPSANTTSTATPGTTKAVLQSASIPANLLSTNGYGLRIKAWFDTAANVNSKTATIDFGVAGAGTTIATVTTTTSAAPLYLQSDVIRLATSSQRSTGFAVNNTTFTALAPVTLTKDETAALAVEWTATTATAAGDVTFKAGVVELLAPPGTGNVGAEVPTGIDLSGLVVRYRAVGI